MNPMQKFAFILHVLNKGWYPFPPGGNISIRSSTLKQRWILFHSVNTDINSCGSDCGVGDPPLYEHSFQIFDYPFS